MLYFFEDAAMIYSIGTPDFMSDKKESLLNSKSLTPIQKQSQTRIEHIKNQINSGHYEINSNTIAQCMLNI
jgi:anti-sigma28 factor (negative regulator of flagellin synthesis)